MQIASNFSLLTRRAVQLLSLKEEEEQVVSSFELGPHAPRISEGIVRSKRGGGNPFSVNCVGWEPGRESSATETAVTGY